MLKEFVEAIAKMALDGVRPTPVCQLTNERTVTLAMPDGTLREEDRCLPPRKANVASLVELAKLNDDMADRFGPHCEVFLDESGAQMLIETAGGHDRVFCPFEQSDAWCLLEETDTGSGIGFDQKTFLRRGRFVLRMTPEQLEPFRKLDFSATQTVVGEVRKTAESLGRSINSRVMSGEPIPDFIELAVPIFTTTGEDELYHVLVDVEISTADQRIIMKPLPGELDRCMARHLAGARERLVKAMARLSPVYLGTCWS